MQAAAKDGLGVSPGCMYKVHYFDGYGRAEAMRMLLSHAGVKWEDRRIDMMKWGGIKGSEMGGKSVPILELPDGT